MLFLVLIAALVVALAYFVYRERTDPVPGTAKAAGPTGATGPAK